MGIVKHGEGSVLPDDEGQKTASQSGLSAEAAAELARENEEADGASDGATED